MSAFYESADERQAITTIQCAELGIDFRDTVHGLLSGRIRKFVDESDARISRPARAETAGANAGHLRNRPLSFEKLVGRPIQGHGDEYVIATKSARRIDNVTRAEMSVRGTRMLAVARAGCNPRSTISPSATAKPSRPGCVARRRRQTTTARSAALQARGRTRPRTSRRRRLAPRRPGRNIDSHPPRDYRQAQADTTVHESLRVDDLHRPGGPPPTSNTGARGSVYAVARRRDGRSGEPVLQSPRLPKPGHDHYHDRTRPVPSPSLL